MGNPTCANRAGQHLQDHPQQPLADRVVAERHGAQKETDRQGVGLAAEVAEQSGPEHKGTEPKQVAERLP